MALVSKISPNDKGNPPGKLADAAAQNRVHELVLEAFDGYEEREAIASHA
jgi:hypothetical protein